MRTLAILLLGLLGACAPSRPRDALVRVEVLRGEDVGALTGIVVSGGDVLTAGIDAGRGPIDGVRVITADGSAHASPGVAAFHRSVPITLLAVDWQGAAPPEAPMRGDDHLGVRRVTIVRADGEEVGAGVDAPEAVSGSVALRPDRLEPPYERPDWIGGAVFDGDGRLVGLVTMVSFSAGLSLAAGPPFATPTYVQYLHCVPGAWVGPLLESRREAPFTWKDWTTTTRDDRALWEEFIDDCRAAEAESPGAALGPLESIARAAPDQPEAWMLLAHARLGSGDADGACEAGARALELDPGSHEAAIILATGAIEAGRRTLAQETMRRAIHMRHESLADYAEDARCLYDAGMVDEAERFADGLLATDPAHGGALRIQREIEASRRRADGSPP